MSYARHFGTRAQTVQTNQAREDQVMNQAGGFVFKLDDFDTLMRFLILGAEGNTYYATERKMVRQNAKVVERCWATDPMRTVQTICAVSQKGRAPKNDAAIFALALGAASDNPKARALALDALPIVCRIGTHLFQFADAVNTFRGWGRGLRKAIANWYTSKDTDTLAHQLVKYQQRNGWSHTDLLRLAHPTAHDESQNTLFRYAVGKDDEGVAASVSLTIAGFEQAKRATSSREIVKLIENFNLTREMIPTQFLKDTEVWEALLVKMPMTAMIRNLGNMGKSGLLVEGNWDTIKIVCDRLTDTNLLRKARIHPIAALSAYRTYGSGRGYRGTGEWPVVSRVVDSLEEAFYKAFDLVQPTGKNIFVGLDVSGSMGMGGIAGVPGLTPRVASGAMCMLHMRSEPNTIVRGFTSGTGSFWGRDSALTDVGLRPRMSLNEVIKSVEHLPFGGTDCALPMLYAKEKNLKVDAFIIYTDNETWAGSIHPFEALKRYRQSTGINSKLIVVGMTATDFTIADPSDRGMLDVVGFDTNAPTVMNSFISGELLG